MTSTGRYLYVGGKKLTRVYGQWFHLDDLEPGEHELRMELSVNDYSPLLACWFDCWPTAGRLLYRSRS